MLNNLSRRVCGHLAELYPAMPGDQQEKLAERLIAEFGADVDAADSPGGLPGADEIVLITYGDTIRDGDELPLHTLGRFWRQWLEPSFSTIHVLPFFPSSSDRGFAVIDYRQIDPALGDWQDLAGAVGSAGLMVDLVCNHCSAASEWFSDFLADREPGRSFFKTAAPTDDLSTVVRPRTHDLLCAVDTPAGVRHAWATFSHDQIDLDFANPDVLAEFCSILGSYLDHGATRVRLDAIAYLWKQIGTSCIHLPQTHHVVKLMRLLIEHRDPSVLLITETNVPHQENVSYLGAGDEAHVVYNFTLAPLIVWSLMTESATALTEWLEQLDPLPPGTTFLNFLASHDGLGLRPIEDRVPSDQVAGLLDAATAVGGDWSPYATPDGDRPYELNVSLVDLLAGPAGETPDRFLVAHMIMLATEGIPAIYVHSILLTPGDRAAVAQTGHRRDINRSTLTIDQAEQQVSSGWQGRLFEQLTAVIAIRRTNDCFDPAATQVAHSLHPQAVVLERRGHTSAVLAVHNTSSTEIEVDVRELVGTTTPAGVVDLLSGQPVPIEAGPLTLGPWHAHWLQLPM